MIQNVISPPLAATEGGLHHCPGMAPCKCRLFREPMTLEHELRVLQTYVDGVPDYRLDNPQAQRALLDTVALNGQRGKSVHPCGPKGLFGANALTGKKFPLSCNRLACPRCIPYLLKWRQIIIANSHPDHFMTLTQVADVDDPDPWKTARIRVKRFFELMRKTYGYVMEYSFTIEMNPKGTGYHAHFVLKSGFVNMKNLRTASKRSGCGTWVKYGRLLGHGRQSIAGYGLKGFKIAGYGMKTFDSDTAAEARRINGGRLEHHSRGFLSVEGTVCDLPTALAHAKKQLYGETEPQPLMLFKDSPWPFAVIDKGKRWDPYEWAIQCTDMTIEQINGWYNRFVPPERVVHIGPDGYPDVVDWTD